MTIAEGLLSYMNRFIQKAAPYNLRHETFVSLGVSTEYGKNARAFQILERLLKNSYLMGLLETTPPLSSVKKKKEIFFVQVRLPSCFLRLVLFFLVTCLKSAIEPVRLLYHDEF